MAASTGIVKFATPLAAVNSCHNHLCPKFDSISLIHGLRGFRPSLLSLAHNHATSGYFLPITRARKSSDYLSDRNLTDCPEPEFDVDFYRITAALRPSTFQRVYSALLKIGVPWIEVCDVVCDERTGVFRGRQTGSGFSENNFDVWMEIIFTKNQVKEVSKIIKERDCLFFSKDPVAHYFSIRQDKRGVTVVLRGEKAVMDDGEEALRMTAECVKEMFSTGSSPPPLPEPVEP